jgi:N6-adenosine-specific RNA methylase IME4
VTVALHHLCVTPPATEGQVDDGQGLPLEVAGRSAGGPWRAGSVRAMATSEAGGDRRLDLAASLLAEVDAGWSFATVLADPPWRFQNRTGKVAPEHHRLTRYDTLDWKEIAVLPVSDLMAAKSHCYLWVPNALVAEGIRVLEGWGFTYKTMLVWHKIRRDGGSDGRGVGFYFRNVTEPVLFGVRGSLRTLAPGRRQVNLVATRKREHSRKPDELYPLIEACSPGPYLELFARHPWPGWAAWGDQAPVGEARHGESDHVKWS